MYDFHLYILPNYLFFLLLVLCVLILWGPLLRCSLKIEDPQRRQRSFFSSRPIWDSPNPSAAFDWWIPPTRGGGGKGNPACGRRGGLGGGVQSQTIGQTLWWYSRYICMYFVEGPLVVFILWVFVRRFTYLVKIESGTWNDYWTR